MGKHKSAEFKYNYVMRYNNGESPTKLGLELNMGVKSPKDIILRWNKQYISNGMKGLEFKTGKGKNNGKGRPKKKPKPNYEDMTKEELLKILEIQDYFIEELKKKTRPRFVYIKIYKFLKTHEGFTAGLLFKVLRVSRSGYYAWLDKKPLTANFKQEWLDAIQNKYDEFKGIYGSERIQAELEFKEDLKLNLKTVKRYMRKLNIKSKIRGPRKYAKKKEFKDTVNIGHNYIKRNFKNDSSRAKLFTDTSEWHLQNGSKIYFSAVVDAQKNLLGLDVSTRNNSELVYHNISRSVKKVGRKYFIQFDNAAFYKNEIMKGIIESSKGIRSFGLPGESQANWPIENFWSILKQEFLKEYDIKNVSDAKALLSRFEFIYNHIRIQKNLKWKTPALARV